MPATLTTAAIPGAMMVCALTMLVACKSPAGGVTRVVAWGALAACYVVYGYIVRSEVKLVHRRESLAKARGRAIPPYVSKGLTGPTRPAVLIKVSGLDLGDLSAAERDRVAAAALQAAGGGEEARGGVCLYSGCVGGVLFATGAGVAELSGLSPEQQALRVQCLLESLPEQCRRGGVVVSVGGRRFRASPRGGGHFAVEPSRAERGAAAPADVVSVEAAALAGAGPVALHAELSGPLREGERIVLCHGGVEVAGVEVSPDPSRVNGFVVSAPDATAGAPASVLQLFVADHNSGAVGSCATCLALDSPAPCEALLGMQRWAEDQEATAALVCDLGAVLTCAAAPGGAPAAVCRTARALAGYLREACEPELLSLVLAKADELLVLGVEPWPAAAPRDAYAAFCLASLAARSRLEAAAAALTADGDSAERTYQEWVWENSVAAAFCSPTGTTMNLMWSAMQAYTAWTSVTAMEGLTHKVSSLLFLGLIVLPRLKLPLVRRHGIRILEGMWCLQVLFVTVSMHFASTGSRFCARPAVSMRGFSKSNVTIINLLASYFIKPTMPLHLAVATFRFCLTAVSRAFNPVRCNGTEQEVAAKLALELFATWVLETALVKLVQGRERRRYEMARIAAKVGS